jgi:hypothetical protein
LGSDLLSVGWPVAATRWLEVGVIKRAAWLLFTVGRIAVAIGIVYAVASHYPSTWPWWVVWLVDACMAGIVGAIFLGGSFAFNHSVMKSKEGDSPDG